MQRALTALAAVLILCSAQIAQAGKVKVLTQNQYLGADLTPVVTAPNLPAFLAAAQGALNQIAANNFPERADALAGEIRAKRPHLVGLQEVFDFTLNGANVGPPFTDHLTELMDRLEEKNADYYVAAVVQNLTIFLPIPGLGVVGVVDRDVILARGDVAAAPTPFQLIPSCRASVDGCNFNVVASVVSPVGLIDIERGFVGVDAIVDGTPYRFVNTHLEVMNPSPSPLAPAIQAAQAFELISVLTGFPSPGAQILVGDINSSPDDPIIPPPPLLIVPPYAQLVFAGFTDAWPLRPGDPPGFTCCHLDDLSNPLSILDERIDVIFSDAVPSDVKANVLGDEPSDKTPSGLWPSDHGAVVGELTFP